MFAPSDSTGSQIPENNEPVVKGREDLQHSSTTGQSVCCCVIAHLEAFSVKVIFTIIYKIS